MPLTRSFEIRAAAPKGAERAPGADAEFDIAFASEEPYERWWGIEILDCTAKAVDLSRLNDGGPVLFNHDWDALRGHHVKNSVRCDADKVVRGKAVISYRVDDGRTIDLIEGGHLTKASIGYEIQQIEEVVEDKDGKPRSRTIDGRAFDSVLTRMKRDGREHDINEFRRQLDAVAGSFERNADKPATYRVTKWRPLENSLVTVPADASVGLGRSAEQAGGADHEGEKPAITSEPKEQQKMTDPKPVDINVEEVRNAATKAGEQSAHKRAAEMLAIGKQYKCAELAADYVGSGKSVEELKSAIIERMANKPLDTADIGLTQKEAKQFSFLRAINALANPGDRKAQDAAGFERECSEAVGAKIGRSAQGIFVPNEVQKRDLTVGTVGAGGYTVATDLLAANFIDLLRNRMMVMNMGAQMLSGLTGSIAIPRQTGGATAYWVAESGAPTESTHAFDQVTMSPKTVGAFSDISRKLLLQSSIDVEGFVRNDLATVLALAIDLAALHGTGASNQPTGIIATSGIGDVAGGTNGLAPTWAHVVELESDVAVANADIGSMGYLTNAKVRGKLKTTEKASNTAQFVWESGGTPLNGYRAGVSNQVASNLTKGTASGVCSAIFFGNWADLIIGQWGTLDLIVDPYTASTTGTVRVVALQDIDIAVRHAESFSAMKDALTA